MPFRFHIPSVTLEDPDEVTDLAFACFLLAYIESISAARALGLRHRYAVDPRQELLGLGMANLAAAVAQGYPVAGGGLGMKTISGWQALFLLYCCNRILLNSSVAPMPH